MKPPNVERVGPICSLDNLSQHVKNGEVITDASTFVHKTLGTVQITSVCNASYLAAYSHKISTHMMHGTNQKTEKRDL